MQHLGVFAKYWQPGCVKTRLATSIGADNAAALYREFVQQTLDRHKNSGDQRAVFIWPPEQISGFQPILPESWSIEAQIAGSLGERMLNYFQQTLVEGNVKSVLIGSDTPRLSPHLIAEAFESLETHPVVLGPSRDGGYYLVGMSESVVDIFTGVAWSTSLVFRQTVELLQQQKLSWHELPLQNDIDDIEDLNQLAAEIASLPNPSARDQALQVAIKKFSHHEHE